MMETLPKSCVEMFSLEEGEQAFRLAGYWAALLSSDQEDDRSLAMLWLMRRLATCGMFLPPALEVDELAAQLLDPEPVGP
jgi:hypothetical protein